MSLKDERCVYGYVFSAKRLSLADIKSGMGGKAFIPHVVNYSDGAMVSKESLFLECPKCRTLKVGKDPRTGV